MNALTPHVHWLAPEQAGDRPVLGVISGSQGTLIVDAGNSAAHANLLLNELAGLDLAPAKFVAITHWHWDHVFGIHTLNLPTFAHAETRRIVTAMAALDWSDEALDQRVAAGQEIAFCRDNIKLELPDRSGLILRPPDIAFNDPITIDLGGVTCQLLPVGGDHASDSVVVYVPEDQVMFIGDCLCEDLYSREPRYTPRKLLPLIDKLLAYDVDFYLEGHAPQPIPGQQMIKDLNTMKIICDIVSDLVPAELPEMIKVLQTRLGAAPDEDQLEFIDTLLNGIYAPY
jgi:glyoxylase-like metal-dependent hydrolase (beta-lactamase superfamily II)